jgi:hypothetical protein
VNTEVRPGLGALGDAWDALVDQSPLPTPFLRSWWLEAVGGGSSAFVLVFDSTKLVGGVALEEGRVLGVSSYRMLGASLAADHLDLVAAPGREQEVVGALRSWFGRPGSRVLDLVGVAEGAQLVTALPGPVRKKTVEHVPWTPLPDSFEAYLAQRPPELRNLVDRPRRRLERAGAVHRIVEPADCASALARMRELHAEQWGARSEFLPWFDRFRRAARTGVERGELAVHELAVNGDVIAVDAFF